MYGSGVVQYIFTFLFVLEFLFISVSHLIYKKRMNDSVISDIFPRSSNMPLVHSSYIAVVRSYISYVSAIHNAFTIYIYSLCVIQTNRSGINL